MCRPRRSRARATLAADLGGPRSASLDQSSLPIDGAGVIRHCSRQGGAANCPATTSHARSWLIDIPRLMAAALATEPQIEKLARDLAKSRTCSISAAAPRSAGVEAR